MTNLDPEICRKAREARKQAGLSQSVVAREIGCKQSALSMFEQGDGTKLNREAIENLCRKFSIPLLEQSGNKASAGSGLAAQIFNGSHERGFCPNPNCPSHQVYEVEGKRFFKPNRNEQDPVGGKFCAVCGEVLEKKCPNCNAPIHEGAVCSFCGTPYVSSCM